MEIKWIIMETRSEIKHNGWLLVDKPEGVSSAQILQPLKRVFGKSTKIGHAGTLDPFASGLLMVAIGNATRLIEYAMHLRKYYTFTITWGKETDTLDPTGVIIQTSLKKPSLDDIKSIIPKFINDKMQQIPPKYSAIKVNGVRAYKMIRERQIDPILQPREMSCYTLTTNSSNASSNASNIDNVDNITFYLECSKGFYVRSLARDLAYALDTVGHVKTLRRLKIGNFSVANAIKIGYTESIFLDKEYVISQLRNSHAILDDILVCHCNVTLDEAQHLKQGRSIEYQFGQTGTGSIQKTEENKRLFAVFDEEGLIAICVYRDNKLFPKKVLI